MNKEMNKCKCGFSWPVVMKFFPGRPPYGHSYYVHCNSCSNNGEISKIKELAIEKWNKQNANYL